MSTSGGRDGIRGHVSYLPYLPHHTLGQRRCYRSSSGQNLVCDALTTRIDQTDREGGWGVTIRSHLHPIPAQEMQSGALFASLWDSLGVTGVVGLRFVESVVSRMRRHCSLDARAGVWIGMAEVLEVTCTFPSTSWLTTKRSISKHVCTLNRCDWSLDDRCLCPTFPLSHFPSVPPVGTITTNRKDEDYLMAWIHFLQV